MSQTSSWKRAALIALALCAFLVGIRALGAGFKLLGQDLVHGFFEVTDNPFAGLLIGVLTTSLVQSSSVTTSIVVALVASPDAPLPISNAVPIVMGANIGTTVTNTVVSIGHVGRPAEFRRAIAAGTCDDFFNLVAVSILLPLEIATGFLEKLSAFVVRIVPRGDGLPLSNPVAKMADMPLDPLRDLILANAPTQLVGAVSFLLTATAILFAAMYVLVAQLRAVAGSRVKGSIAEALDASPFVGIVVGALLTALVQSSSLTLSALVPFAGTGIVTLEQIFPLVLGANFGTTITAFMASTAAPAETFREAVQIAVVHMMFNTAGISMIYPVRRVRRIPLDLSRWIARTAVESKARAAVYVILLFYAAPAVALYVWHQM